MQVLDGSVQKLSFCDKVITAAGLQGGLMNRCRSSQLFLVYVDHKIEKEKVEVPIFIPLGARWCYCSESEGSEAYLRGLR